MPLFLRKRGRVVLLIWTNECLFFQISFSFFFPLEFLVVVEILNHVAKTNERN